MRLHLGQQTLAAAAMVALLAGCGGGMSPGQLGATGSSTAAQLRSTGGAGAVRPFQSSAANAAARITVPRSNESWWAIWNFARVDSAGN